MATKRPLYYHAHVGFPAAVVRHEQVITTSCWSARRYYQHGQKGVRVLTDIAARLSLLCFVPCEQSDMNYLVHSLLVIKPHRRYR
jgi:hypothetical protein